jgi:hypothetical protein
MSDLDNLASAARRISRPAKRRRAMPVWAILAAITIGGAVIGAVAISVALHGLAANPLTAISRATASDPEFTVDFGEKGAGVSGQVAQRYFEIENRSNAPLTINSVTYNGEFSATPGGDFMYGMLFTDHARNYPITIGIGETARFFVYWIGGGKSSYSKDVVYTDIETNRGTYRYQDGGLSRK